MAAAQLAPGRLLTVIGTAWVSVLLVFFFLIGVISLNWKILVSTLPFVFAAFFALRQARKK